MIIYYCLFGSFWLDPFGLKPFWLKPFGLKPYPSSPRSLWAAGRRGCSETDRPTDRLDDRGGIVQKNTAFPLMQKSSPGSLNPEQRLIHMYRSLKARVERHCSPRGEDPIHWTLVYITLDNGKRLHVVRIVM